jgi:uncharacterized protein
MRITFDEVLAAPGAVVQRVIHEAIPSGVPEVTFRAPVRGQLELRAVGSRVLVSGEAATDVDLTCSRCLGTFAAALSTRVEEIFEPRPAAGKVSTEGGVLIVPSPEGTIDVDELLRQHLVLVLPYAPVCRAECTGLCSVCGTDRNQRDCGCTPKTSDPRLAVLTNVLRGTQTPELRPGDPAEHGSAEA